MAASLVLTRLTSTSSYPLIGVGSAVLIAGLASAYPSPTRTTLSWRPLRLLGLVSYAIYLWHYPLLRYGQLVGLSPLVCLAATAAFATVSYRYVERPALRLKTRFSRRPAAQL
jgi:peptidoglycan/LPS O-acetylase OafA/YrhL